MKLRLYSIRDRLMGVYLSPFPSRADVEAVRQVAAAFSDPQMRQTPIVSSPKDYDLCYLGDFDDETGVLHSASTAQILKNLADIAPSSALGTVPS